MAHMGVICVSQRVPWTVWVFDREQTPLQGTLLNCHYCLQLKLDPLGASEEQCGMCLLQEVEEDSTHPLVPVSPLVKVCVMGC